MFLRYFGYKVKVKRPSTRTLIRFGECELISFKVQNRRLILVHDMSIHQEIIVIKHQNDLLVSNVCLLV